MVKKGFYSVVTNEKKFGKYIGIKKKDIYLN
jgi:hypothetical protein